MKVLNLVPGTPEWLAHRAQRGIRNASEASIIMGCNPKLSRAEYVRLKATGGEKEISRYVQEVVFERGHEVEAKALPVAEERLGVSLYPVRGESDEYPGLCASFDGLDMANTIAWECKQWNKDKAESVKAGCVPQEDYWQVVHQLIVSRAEKNAYTVTDGTAENYVSCDAVLDPEDEKRLLMEWDQVEADIANWKPEAPRVEAVGRRPINLPSLYVQLAGGVQASNLPEFKAAAIEVFESIPTDLKTDQDFADAAETVKWCEEIEGKLKAAKANAQGQMFSVDELFRAIDEISDVARTKRLALDKLVNKRKEEIRAQIVFDARKDYEVHLANLNKGLAVPVLGQNAFADTVALAMKGRKTIDTLRDSAAQALATAKVTATAEAQRFAANLAVLTSANRPELFGDRDALVRSKQPEDLANLVKARIAEADAREQARLDAERARIRAEEEERARQQAEQLAEKERARIREEEQARAQAQHEAISTAPTLQKVLDEVAPAPVANAMRAANDFTTMPGQARPAETPAAVEATTEAAPVAAVRPGATLKLGEINARIAPLTITGDGLAALGFKPVGMDKAAKLYRESDFPLMVRAMGKVLRDALDASGVKAAA